MCICERKKKNQKNNIFYNFSNFISLELLINQVVLIKIVLYLQYFITIGTYRNIVLLKKKYIIIQLFNLFYEV